jgi:hypothetical protein
MKTAFLSLVAFVAIWAVLIKPIVAEYYLAQAYVNTDSREKLRLTSLAMKWNPRSSLIRMQFADACLRNGLVFLAKRQVDSLLIYQDGDLTQWGIYGIAGSIAAKMGQKQEAIALWKTGLLYWPNAKEIIKMMEGSDDSHKR